MQVWTNELTRLKEMLEAYKENKIDQCIELLENTKIDESFNSEYLLNQVKTFFKDIGIQLHDVPVKSMDDEHLLDIRMGFKKVSKHISTLTADYFMGEITKETFLKKMEEIENYVMKRFCKQKSPYYIPILKASEDKDSYILIKEFSLQSNYLSLDISRRNYVEAIFLSCKQQHAYEEALVHELVHSQFLEDDTIYREVLPIFFELIYKNDKKALLERIDLLLEKLKRNQEYYTVSTVPCEIERKEALHNQIYIISTIYAIGLYDLYQKSNVSEKEKLMQEIQSVFDKKQLVEILLSRFDFDNEIEVVKQYCKKERCL